MSHAATKTSILANFFPCLLHHWRVTYIMTWSPWVQVISAEVERNLGASACSSGSPSLLHIHTTQSSAALALLTPIFPRVSNPEPNLSARSGSDQIV